MKSLFQNSFKMKYAAETSTNLTYKLVFSLFLFTRKVKNASTKNILGMAKDKGMVNANKVKNTSKAVVPFFNINNFILEPFSKKLITLKVKHIIRYFLLTHK